MLVVGRSGTSGYRGVVTPWREIGAESCRDGPWGGEGKTITTKLIMVKVQHDEIKIG